MSRSLTAADRSALIRLASTMPAGSEERRAILAGLSRASSKHGLSNDALSLKHFLEAIHHGFEESSPNNRYSAFRRNLPSLQKNRIIRSFIEFRDIVDRLHRIVDEIKREVGDPRPFQKGIVRDSQGNQIFYLDLVADAWVKRENEARKAFYELYDMVPQPVGRGEPLE